jgi:hypothetical protein
VIAVQGRNAIVSPPARFEIVGRKQKGHMTEYLGAFILVLTLAMGTGGQCHARTPVSNT